VISLLRITGAHIMLDMTYTYSTMQGEDPIITSVYPDYHNLQFEIYSQKQEKEITNYVYQYPELILPEIDDIDDVINITVTGILNDFNPIQITTNLDRFLKADVLINIVQHGSCSATY